MRELRALVLSLAMGLAVACAGDGGSEPAPAASAADQLGREIGETYMLLLEDAEAILALELPSSQLRPALRLLQDDYRVRLANLGCLREALDQDVRLQVTRGADAYILANGGQDTPWLVQAVERYGGEPELEALLIQLPSLRIYAFFDQLARVRPGEQILCNG